jgi:hypothetical protein
LRLRRVARCRPGKSAGAAGAGCELENDKIDESRDLGRWFV